MALFLLIVGAVVVNVIGQVTLKQGMIQVGRIRGDLASLWPFLYRTLTTPLVLIGLITYALGTFLWLGVLSRIDLSIAYPSLSLGYVVVVLVSRLVLREQVSVVRWLGVLIICAGVYLITRS